MKPFYEVGAWYYWSVRYIDGTEAVHCGQLLEITNARVSQWTEAELKSYLAKIATGGVMALPRLATTIVGTLSVVNCKHYNHTYDTNLIIYGFKDIKRMADEDVEIVTEKLALLRLSGLRGAIEWAPELPKAA